MRSTWISAGSVLLVVSLATAGQTAPTRGLDIYWVDVEGGAATLVVTPAGESILFDTGWPGARDAGRIVAAAQEAGVSRIDHLVTTHWHGDHFGGLAELARRIPIGRYYDHGFPDGTPRDIPAELQAAYLHVTGGRSTVLRPGDTLSLRETPGAPRVWARVVSAHGLVAGEEKGAPQTRACSHADHTALPDDQSDNQRSVGMVVGFGDFELLDLGDLTWNVEHKLACPRNLVGPVDVYQVTHHGLDDSSNPALMRAVTPTVAIVNNGPRKGGKAPVYKALRALGGLQDIFQVHRNVETGPEDNAPALFVANDDEKCAGRGLHLRVDPAGKQYTVSVAGKGTTRQYAVK